MNECLFGVGFSLVFFLFVNIAYTHHNTVSMAKVKIFVRHHRSANAFTTLDCFYYLSKSKYERSSFPPPPLSLVLFERWIQIRHSNQIGMFVWIFSRMCFGRHSGAKKKTPSCNLIHKDLLFCANRFSFEALSLCSCRL